MNCSKCGEKYEGSGSIESYPENKATCSKCTKEEMETKIKIKLLKEMIKELEKKIE